MVPFLKWAGGKRWLFDSEFIERLPRHDRYVEPFLGGGAGFFAVNPMTALLSDVNPDLIRLYEVVRDEPGQLVEQLAHHNGLHSERHYYDTRSSTPADKVGQAARMLYLNRTCWNGLYRLNKSGQFNVPIGTKSTVIMPTDNFYDASLRLRHAEINLCDFEQTIDRSGQGDLLFIDPPYTVQHNMNGFVKYNERIFSWADQIRLHAAIVRATDRGASIVLTNADHASVRNLYRDFGKQRSVPRSSVISGNSKGRSSVTELVVFA